MKKDMYSGSYKEKSNKTRRNVKILVMAVVLLVCTLTISIVAAKYISEKSSDGSVRANNFYFTSNLLDGKKHTLDPGSTSITFTLGNHEDNLRYSEVDINYEVTVNNGATVKDGTGTGKLAKNHINDAKVTIQKLKPGTYTVTAVGKGGYEKTLTATIEVPAEAPRIYYHIDNSGGEYTLLTVWNEGDVEGIATVKYEGIPDNTNPNMTEWKTSEGSQGKPVTIEPHESKIFRFFNETNIKVDDAVPKEPN